MKYTITGTVKWSSEHSYTHALSKSSVTETQKNTNTLVYIHANLHTTAKNRLEKVARR